MYAGALPPHEIIRYMSHENVGEVAERQWKVMLEDIIRKKKQLGQRGKIFNNCLAVFKANEPVLKEYFELEKQMALTLLMAELNEEPWKGKVINYSSEAQLHAIQGDEVTQKCEFLMKMDTDWEINFEKVFDLILEEALKWNLKPEQMINKVFVFSFVNAFYKEDSENRWKDAYVAIESKFKEKGYENAVPQIVHWRTLWDNDINRKWMKDSKHPGVTVLNGFSNNLIKLLLENGMEIRPDLAMEAAISGKEHQQLVVVD